MPSSIYQLQDNADQIKALKSLADETRLLIDNIIESSASAEVLKTAQATLQTLNQTLGAERNNETAPRPLKHFNFSAAIKNTQEVLPYSPVSGHFNPIAPPANIHFDTTQKKTFATVTCSRAYEGPPGMVHGAVIAGIYDQLLALTSTCHGKAGPTAYLNTQFLQPTLLYQELTFSAWIERSEGRKVYIKGQCEVAGTIISTADALCIEHRG